MTTIWPPPPPAFTCPDCKRKSWNPNDRINNFCSACDKFFPIPDLDDEIQIALAKYAPKTRWYEHWSIMALAKLFPPVYASWVLTSAPTFPGHLSKTAAVVILLFAFRNILKS